MDIAHLVYTPRSTDRKFVNSFVWSDTGKYANIKRKLCGTKTIQLFGDPKILRSMSHACREAQLHFPFEFKYLKEEEKDFSKGIQRTFYIKELNLLSRRPYAVVQYVSARR
ncbi:MAG TPA: hypothetical protein VKE88_00225, partial [Candidatus Nanoarchaeia archaeon]|nr:hypothetical protein [Candidatus Nanoarchaeia archaeon]